MMNPTNQNTQNHAHWAKEQENNALKVQNRHLVSQLNELEKRSSAQPINVQALALEVRQQIKPVIDEIQKQVTAIQAQQEKNLKQAFELMQSTLRGVYQQTQRAQNAIETSTLQTRDLENRMAEARKADLVFFQEKIFSLISAFLDRMERQIDQRLSNLGALDVIVTKQNEALVDLEALRNQLLQISRNTEGSKSEVNRVEKTVHESIQKLLELEAQGRNTEEALRDTYQQVQNHRAEFKLARAEIRAVIEQAQKVNEKVTIIDERISENVKDIRTQAAEHERMRQEIRVAEAAEGVDELIRSKNDDIQNIQSAVLQGSENASQEDLTMVLQLLKSQKDNLKAVAKNAENYLRGVRPQQENQNEVVAADTSIAEINAIKINAVETDKDALHP